MEILNPIFDHLYFVYICLFSLLAGSVIGLERELSKKPAGLKTHVMICLGATVITYLSANTANGGDPTRIAAQIVSGIGFIGAGTILQSRSAITGLTSAATIWMVAGIGMLIGARLHVEALIVLIVVALFFKGYKSVFRHASPERFYCLNIEVRRIASLEKIEDMVDKFGLGLKDKQLVKTDTIHLELSYTANALTQHLFLKRLLRLPGVGHVITA